MINQQANITTNSMNSKSNFICWNDAKVCNKFICKIHFNNSPKIESNAEFQDNQNEQVLNFNFKFKFGAQVLIGWTWIHTLHFTLV
jgi:hypothetical protein